VKPVLAGGIATSIVALANASPPWVLALATAIVLTILAGVMLPAVWSSDSSRRKDALSTLELILQFSVKLVRALLGKDSD
jgi:hypothetical protein